MELARALCNFDEWSAREKESVLEANWQLPAHRELISFLIGRHYKLDKKDGRYRYAVQALRHAAGVPAQRFDERFPFDDFGATCRRETATFLDLILLTEDLGDHSDLVLLAVKAGADPNQIIVPCDPGYECRTVPLGVAVYARRMDVARELISRGARPNGATLYVAINAQSREMVDLLLAEGDDPNFLPGDDIRDPGRRPRVPLELALKLDDHEIVEKLLSAGADPALVRQCLHHA